MAITITTPASGAPAIDTLGKFKVVVAEVDITSYTTGGETIAPGDFNLTTVVGIHAISTELAFVPRTNATFTRLLLHGGGAAGAALGEVASAANGGTFRLMVFGH